MQPRCTRDAPKLVLSPQALVEKVCKDVTTRAKLSDETIGTTTTADEESGGLEGRGKHRSKSMARLKQEQQARVAAVRRAAMEAQVLGEFIRLADYMTVSCCYLLTVGTAEKLAEILQAPRASPPPFHVSPLHVSPPPFHVSSLHVSPPHFHVSPLRRVSPPPFHVSGAACEERAVDHKG